MVISLIRENYHNTNNFALILLNMKMAVISKGNDEKTTGFLNTKAIA